MSEWIQGSPNAPGYYWVVMCDQGGWPSSPMVAYITTEWNEDISDDEFFEATMKYISDKNKDDTIISKMQHMVISIPEYGISKKPLKDIWNFNCYMKMIVPKYKHEDE